MTARSRLAWRVLVVAAFVAIGGGFAVLHAVHVQTYEWLMGKLGVHVIGTSFIDWRYIPAQIECAARGVDVYVHTPCDVLGRPMGYSPLWLALTFLPTGPAGVTFTIAAILLAFVVTVALLPAPATIVGRLILFVAALSPATLLALERANADVIMFVFLVIAAWFSTGGGMAARLAHGWIIVAAALKFYPVVGAVVAVRERRLLTVAAIAACYALILGSGLLMALPEVRASLRNVPQFSYFQESTVGAINLPFGIAELAWRHAQPAMTNAIGAFGVRIPLPPAYAILAKATLILCCLLSLAASFLIARLGRLSARADRTDFRTTLFIVGTAVIDGCFLTGQSIPYRLIVLLMPLPLLVNPAGILLGRWRAFPGIVAAVAALLMWVPALQADLFWITGELFKPGAVVKVVWLGRELLWWGFVSALNAVLAMLMIDALRENRLFGLIGSRPARRDGAA